MNLKGCRTDRRPWGVGDDGRIGNLLEKTQCERSGISQRKWKIYFPIEDGRIKTLGGDQDLRTSILVRHRPIQGKSNIDFLGESEGSLPQPHDSLQDAGEATNDFLVHVGKRHLPPSRWTPSQTLVVEKRIIPYSIKIHWRLQNYTNKFGCQGREAHRWLLEYRWVSRLVWSLDKFHNLLYLMKNLLTDIHGPGGD